MPAPAAPPAAGTAHRYGPGFSPLVRRLATEHGVDLSALTGTGARGRVRKQDVLDAVRRMPAPRADRPAAPAPPVTAQAASPPATGPAALPAARGQAEPVSGPGTAAAARAAQCPHHPAPHTAVVEADVTAIGRLCDDREDGFLAREGVELSFLPFLTRAAADALKAHPRLDAAPGTESGRTTRPDSTDVRVAIDTGTGPLTAVVTGAGDLSVAGLARRIAGLAERARTGRLTADESAGGTFTVTDAGGRGALFCTPVTDEPRVAALGAGAVVKRPVVVEEAGLGEVIAIRRMVHLTLAYDHRAVGGADAARFLTDVKRRLEEARFEI